MISLGNENDVDTDVLISHEDGSVQFWDVTNISMPLLYKLKTSDYFQIEQAPIDDTDEETWPPFRKVRWFAYGRFFGIHNAF